MIIDVHTHNFSEGSKTFTAKDLIASMDEAGIDFSMLIADGAVGGSSTEEVIKICEENPRLKPIGCMDYATVDASQIENLVDLLTTKKIYGVKFYPGYQNFYPYDEKLLTLYKQCESLGKPVIFHTGFLMEGHPGRLKQSQPLNLDDVANAFPNLKIIMAHFGNPWIMDAMMVLVKNPNVYIDVSGYFKIYVPIDPKIVKYFIQDLTYIKNYVGDFKRFLFGTDWPLYSQREYVESVKKLPLNDEEKELVFWKNAKQIFDLEI